MGDELLIGLDWELINVKTSESTKGKDVLKNGTIFNDIFILN